jgi:hypothetical protein
MFLDKLNGFENFCCKEDLDFSGQVPYDDSLCREFSNAVTARYHELCARHPVSSKADAQAKIWDSRFLIMQEWLDQGRNLSDLDILAIEDPKFTF